MRMRDADRRRKRVRERCEGERKRIWEVEEDSKKGTERGERDRQRRVSETECEVGGRRESGKQGVGEVEARGKDRRV